ncbi:hypothetical protein N7490_010537 [Penicillium lividum]|nr:hypothetical protein N7490_010537 [Penicillium lividum]
MKSLDELDSKMKQCIKGLATLVAQKAEEKANENKVEELEDLTEPCCQLKSELTDTILLDESLESKMDSLESRVDSLESWLQSIQDDVAALKIKADDASSEELLSQNGQTWESAIAG